MAGLAMQILPEENVEDKVTLFGDTIWENGEHEKLNRALRYPRMHMLDGVHYNLGADGKRDYLMGFRIPEDGKLKEYKTIVIPAGSWAVFTAHADMSDRFAIRTLWKRIYTEWFPNTDYEEVPNGYIEHFAWEDEKYDTYICEIWIPVKRKDREK